jgi:diphthamide biosynthesis protein 3
MASIYDEVEIEDLTYNAATRLFTHPCPCGDKFQLSAADLLAGEDIAPCPSCSLRIRIVLDPDTLEAYIAALDAQAAASAGAAAPAAAPAPAAAAAATAAAAE